MMKKINSFTAALVLCLVAAIAMSFCVGAATPREMLENGEVSDGSVTFGDKRDGIVSDVSEEMGDLGGEMSEFAGTGLPGADSTDGINTTDSMDITQDMTSASTAEPQAERTDATGNMDDAGGGNDDSTNTKWGIVIAVIVVIVVVALIFFFIKRS